MGTTPNLAELDAELNQMVLSGKAMEAFEKFYDDNVSMQENSDPVTVGKDTNRQREIDFFGSVEQFHGAAVTAGAIGDDLSFCEWMMDITFKGAPRMKMEQVAVRHWKDGKIVSERFFYNKG